MKSIIKIGLTVWISALVLMLIAACQNNGGEAAPLPDEVPAEVFLPDETAKDVLLSEKELHSCRLFINNTTCSDMHELRTVPDEDICGYIISLTATAVPFRPCISSDLLMGVEKPNNFITFRNEDLEYGIYFPDADKQMNPDYVHWDAPVISIGKTVLEDLELPRQYRRGWGWYYTMTAEDYAALFELVSTYTDGEIIKEEDLPSFRAVT